MKTDSAGRRIEVVSLIKLAEMSAPRNPKTHARDTIEASLTRFGFTVPILVDERTGRIVAGHGRRDALTEMHKRGAPPPGGVEVVGGEWWVPTIRGWASKDDREAEAYLIADNKLTEAGGWDNTELDAMLADIALVSADLPGGDVSQFLGTGMESEDLDRVLRDALPEDVDEVPPVPEMPWVKRGDLFQLGAHRLMCGDSTSGDDVRRLMNGERAGLMNTDPPYGVAYANEDRPSPGVAKPRVANDTLSDEQLQTFLESAFRAAVNEAIAPDAAWYLWHAHLTQGYFAAAAAAAAAANVVLHRQIIWVKPVLLLGRGHYHWKHEPCFMGWVKGSQPPDYGRGDGERDQTTVWEIGGVNQADRKEFNHATPKPVALFEIPITKHLRAGEICFEPFAGSGPQLIAAEHLRRRCFAMELEPRHAQTCLARWEKFTGQKAKKL